MVTAAPSDSIRDVVAQLSEHNVGAVVVTDGGALVGILSERDVVRHLHLRGEAILREHAADLMTSDVATCQPTDDVSDVAATMTERRVRHMPVLDQGHLAGIVTIGDVVAARIRQLEHDRGQLEQYITQG